MALLRAASSLGLLGAAAAHGAITIPGPSRNSVDSNIAPWSNVRLAVIACLQQPPTPPRSAPADRPVHPAQGVPAHVPFEYMCPFPSITEAAKSHGTRNLSATNGQACFWFSNGCAPGCERCDGSTRGVVPKFEQVTGTTCGAANGTCPPSVGTWRKRSSSPHHASVSGDISEASLQ